ncbi:hypothetical protein WN55_01179 [Dufourea novaeangliae]|uniref:Uncharacterized protein n=1 Tax=Dufourea novaeangliae TaxID=178035 RepID=A0A154PE99_DUFNO|nr:hypothetical protein WN55_01179 [Dufourea novaeangliae]
MLHTVQLTVGISIYAVFVYRAVRDPEKYQCWSRFPLLDKEVYDKAEYYIAKAKAEAAALKK